MNFNVYIDDETVRRIDRIARRSGESRNAIIRRALHAWVARESNKGWPESVLGFTGDPNMPRFEASRAKLRRPKSDPLAA